MGGEGRGTGRRTGRRTQSAWRRGKANCGFRQLSACCRKLSVTAKSVNGIYSIPSTLFLVKHVFRFSQSVPLDFDSVLLAVGICDRNQLIGQLVNYLVPEGPRLAKGPVASSVVRSLCLAHLVLTSCHEDMLLDCAIACVPRYMGLRTQHRVIDKTRFLLQPRYTQSEYANKP